MSRKGQLQVFFTLLVVLVELGLLMVFLDLSMRGSATTLWSIAVWPFVVFPIMYGWLFYSRKSPIASWALILAASAFCLWYFLSQYGTGLFAGSMLIIGLPAIVVVLLLVLTVSMRTYWPKLREA